MMESSCCLTVDEMKLVNLAFQRKYDCYRRHAFGFKLPSFLDSSFKCDNDPTNSFISQSRHHIPEILRVNDILKIHAFEFFSVYIDISRCEEIVFQQRKRGFSRIRTRDSEEASHQNSVSLLQRFLCLRDERHLMSTPLKKILKRVAPHRKLLFIVTLLVDFHYGNECGAFLSVAFKLCLKASELLIRCSGDHIRYDYGYLRPLKLCKYLQMMQINQCEEHLFSVAMRAFNMPPEMRSLFFFSVPDLKFLLQIWWRNDLSLLSLLNSYEPGSLRSYDICLAANYQNFVALVEFGAFSFYSKEDLDIMKRRGIRRCDNSVLNEEAPMPVFGRFRLRLSQTVSLFQKSINSKPHSFSEAVFVLKLLWASIPDPFLTEEEIKECLNEPVNEMSITPKENRYRPGDYSQSFSVFHTLKDYPDTAASEYLHRTTTDISGSNVQNKIYPSLEGTPFATTVSQAWQWYKEIILQRESLVKSPRSLQHLSRCKIRQCLAMNFQLPAGVQTLNFPVTVMNYLLLKDCGDNPFESEDSVAEKLLNLHTYIAC